jgi:hypothetical protein
MDQSIEKLMEEVEKRPALYLKSLKEYSEDVVGRGVCHFDRKFEWPGF